MHSILIPSCFIFFLYLIRWKERNLFHGAHWHTDTVRLEEALGQRSQNSKIRWSRNFNSKARAVLEAILRVHQQNSCLGSLHSQLQIQAILNIFINNPLYIYKLFFFFYLLSFHTQLIYIFVTMKCDQKCHPYHRHFIFQKNQTPTNSDQGAERHNGICLWHTNTHPIFLDVSL